MPSIAHDGTALFLKRWLRRPFAVGAVMPSGPWLTHRIARTTLAALQDREGHVVELGAGTGEVTKALLAVGIPASRLAVIEYDPELSAFLRRRFGGTRSAIRIIEGDAARLRQLLSHNGVEQVAAVVSSLPLLSLPNDLVNGIVAGVFEMLPRGGEMVQFTYGPSSPVPRELCEKLRLQARRVGRVWRNVPPAVVWTFSKP